MNKLSLNNTHFEQLSINARAEWHYMSIYLGVVSAFVEECIAYEVPGYENNNHRADRDQKRSVTTKLRRPATVFA